MQRGLQRVLTPTLESEVIPRVQKNPSCQRNGTLARNVSVQLVATALAHALRRPDCGWPCEEVRSRELLILSAPPQSCAGVECTGAALQALREAARRIMVRDKAQLTGSENACAMNAASRSATEHTRHAWEFKSPERLVFANPKVSAATPKCCQGGEGGVAFGTPNSSRAADADVAS